MKIEVRHFGGELDEVILTDDSGHCIFHLEQMSDTHWWMGIGDEKRSVHVHLTTKRATISGRCYSEGEVEQKVTDGGQRLKL